MISIKKDFDSPPAKLVESNRNTQLLDALTTKNKHKFNSSIYRKTTIEALKLLYNNKCAYCESDGSASAPFQVEHFRPKAKTEEDDNHNGYYWLAYEWSNLILGCSSCNRAKGNYFPVKGTRIVKPLVDEFTSLPLTNYLKIDSDELKGEEAILLNPEIDEVENHFYFIPNGEVVGIDNRGKVTIEKLQLNRQPLRIWRKKIVDSYLDEMQRILTDFGLGRIKMRECQYAMKQVFIRIALQQNPKTPYSRFGFFMFNKFEIFFANQLKNKQREAVLKFFDLFKRGEL